jgi:pilus assembly protein CpaC
MNKQAMNIMALITVIIFSSASVQAQKATVTVMESKDTDIVYFTDQTNNIFVPTGKSQLVIAPEACETVSIGDPTVCDITMINSNKFLLIGQKTGQTNIYLWFADGEQLSSSITVHDDVLPLEALLQQMLPDEKEIDVYMAHNTVILSGYVERSTSILNALRLAEAYMEGQGAAEEGGGCVKVVNMLNVREEKQILLEVRFVEVTRTTTDDKGFDFTYVGDIDRRPVYLSFLDGGTPTTFDATTGAGTAGTGSSFGYVRNTNSESTVSYGLDYLITEGLARYIAKPNLMVRNGEEASFLAGGEFPISIQSQDGIAIEWKEYGVKLTFTPVLDERDNIYLDLEPEVSALDSAVNTILTTGVDVPALKTRKTHTKIVLKEGESFYISGILTQDETESLSKMPGIGNIPVLGTLFHKKEKVLQETELIVFVTPRIVKPIPKAVEKDFNNPVAIQQITDSLPERMEDTQATMIRNYIEQGENVTPAAAAQTETAEAENIEQEGKKRKIKRNFFFRLFNNDNTTASSDADGSEMSA